MNKLINSTITTFMKNNPFLLFHPLFAVILALLGGAWQGGTVLSAGEFLSLLSWEKHDISAFFVLFVGI